MSDTEGDRERILAKDELRYESAMLLSLLAYPWCIEFSKARYEFGNPIYGQGDYVKIFIKKDTWKAMRTLAELAEGKENKD